MTKGKKYIALGLYESGWLEVFFNPRADGVVVPEHIKALQQVKFDYGEGLPIPIPDLVIDDRGISATLSFNREPFQTFLPWASIYYMTTLTPGQQGSAVWPEDVPRALLQSEGEVTLVEGEFDALEQAEAAVGARPSAPTKRERPAWLKVVD